MIINNNKVYNSVKETTSEIKVPSRRYCEKVQLVPKYKHASVYRKPLSNNYFQNKIHFRPALEEKNSIIPKQILCPM